MACVFTAAGAIGGTLYYVLKLVGGDSLAFYYLRWIVAVNGALLGFLAAMQVFLDLRPWAEKSRLMEWVGHPAVALFGLASGSLLGIVLGRMGRDPRYAVRL